MGCVYKRYLGPLGSLTSSWKPFGTVDFAFCALRVLKPYDHTIIIIIMVCYQMDSSRQKV